ncbi:DMT family transporter [Microbaculum marinisediminis]|uniref:DMT family transporter n=1 Tax=Microbaculum marinisediminis TaxID=2931392 RepID=A0AAW5R2T8_9HYPH|nr:DMT family transporter [Microbaculum sp. A6E488]MCT8974537.1 DMT family transporter [Microbaculum sp. A6E488]
MRTDPPAPAAAPPDETVFVRIMPGLFVLLWSTGYIGARAAAGGAEPLSFLFLRFVLAGALLLIAALIGRASWPRRGRATADSMIAGALLQGGYLGGVFWAVYHGLPAGIAALIVALQPMLTGLLAGPFLGEKVTRSHWFGLVVGLVGLALVLGPRIEMTGTGITPVTVGATLFAVLSIVLGSIWQKAHAANTDLRTGTFLQYVGGAIVVGVGALATEDLRIDWTGEVIFAMAWLVLVLSIGAILIYMVLIRRGAIARLSTLFYLVPPCTALIAWALYGETLTLVQIAGMAVTVGGVAIATRPAT